MLPDSVRIDLSTAFYEIVSTCYCNLRCQEKVRTYINEKTEDGKAVISSFTNDLEKQNMVMFMGELITRLSKSY